MCDGTERVDYTVKLILCGDVGVGKTTLLYRYITGRYNCMLRASDDMGVREKIITRDGLTVRLLIWDTAGQERFRSMTNSYYRNTDGCLLMFDMTQPSSFDGVLRWHHELTEFCQTMPQMILVGTKCHASHREVLPGRAEKLAEHLNIQYMEVSPELDINVSAVFENLADLVLKEKEERRKSILLLHRSLSTERSQKKTFSCGC